MGSIPVLRHAYKAQKLDWIPTKKVNSADALHDCMSYIYLQ